MLMGDEQQMRVLWVAYVVGVHFGDDVLDVPAVEQTLLPQGLLELLHRDVPVRQRMAACMSSM